MELYLLAIQLPFLSVGFVANLLIIIAHVVDPLRVFQNISSMFVLNITVIDCTICLLWTILGSLLLADFTEFISNDYYISFATVAVRIATMMSIAYFSLAMELYLSISRPLWHRTKITRKNCRYWIISTWIFHLASNELAIRFLLPYFYEFLFIVVYTCSFFLIIQFLNVATFLSLRKQGKTLRELRDVSGAMKTRQKNQKRFFVTIAILSVIQTLTFCPFFVITFLTRFRYLVPETSLVVWIWLEWSTQFFIIINAMINPFFYLWRLPKYKKTFKKLYCKCL